MSARPIATTRSSAGIATGKLAVWWVVASEIVIFGGLLGSYIMHRLAHDAWAEQAAHTNVWIGAFNTFVLLTSSLSAVLAHQAAEQGNGPKAARLLYYFWSFYYTAAGLHALHVIAGAIIMAFVAATAKKNLELHRVELIGIYWHFVDIVWIFLFPLLYIAK
jgi:heme/copper-type cytochrome/quinol oxidase subunit 3